MMIITTTFPDWTHILDHLEVGATNLADVIQCLARLVALSSKLNATILELMTGWSNLLTRTGRRSRLNSWLKRQHWQWPTIKQNQPEWNNDHNNRAYPVWLRPQQLCFFLCDNRDTITILVARVRPLFHMRVSAGAFQRSFPRKKKCISIHAETRLRNHGIRLVVARHFHCLYKFKVVYMRIVSVWTTRARKSRSSSSVSARG